MKLAKYVIFFFVVLAILLLFGRFGYLDRISGKISLNIAVPLVNLITKPIVSIKNFFGNIYQANALAYDNYMLRQQLANNEIKYSSIEDLQAKIQRLEQLLKLNNEIHESVAARVVAKNITGMNKTIIIDAGTKQGIVKGMPVLSTDGLVGKISECGLYYSKVIL